MNAVDMSTKADPDVYVLGDASQQGDMPKSIFKIVRLKSAQTRSAVH